MADEFQTLKQLLEKGILTQQAYEDALQRARLKKLGASSIKCCWVIIFPSIASIIACALMEEVWTNMYEA